MFEVESEFVTDVLNAQNLAETQWAIDSDGDLLVRTDDGFVNFLKDSGSILYYDARCDLPIRQILKKGTKIYIVAESSELD